MRPRHLHLRFARTADEAFRTARYGAAIEKPWPSFWRRMFNLITGRD